MAPLAPLLSVLKFKNLLTQLSAKEFASFLTEFSEAVGREEIMELLCTRFVASKNSLQTTFNQNDHLNPLNTMTKIASHIIRRRKSDCSAPHLSTINDLPSSMVGEVASYLDQESYAALSRTNRKLFVDTNSPNRLLEVFLHNMSEDSTVQLQRFNQTRTLLLHLKTINQIEPSNGAKFAGLNQLKELMLYGSGGAINDLDELINDPALSFASVSSLTVFGFNTVDLNGDKLLQILSKFDNLSHLKLQFIIGSGVLQLNQLQTLCSNLKQLEVVFVNASWAPNIVESFCSRVNTLTVSLGPRWSFNASNYDFMNMKRLCLCGMSVDRVNSLLNRSKSLREISWIPNISTPSTPTLDAQEVQDMVQQCIVKQPLLEYFHISTRGHFEGICSGIHRGMFMTNKHHRDQFEIALDVNTREITSADEFICSLSKIVQVLGLCEIT